MALDIELLIIIHECWLARINSFFPLWCRSQIIIFELYSNWSTKIFKNIWVFHGVSIMSREIIRSGVGFSCEIKTQYSSYKYRSIHMIYNFSGSGCGRIKKLEINKSELCITTINIVRIHFKHSCGTCSSPFQAWICISSFIMVDTLNAEFFGIFVISHFNQIDVVNSSKSWIFVVIERIISIS